jgi:hypothetical protein
MRDVFLLAAIRPSPARGAPAPRLIEALATRLLDTWGEALLRFQLRAPPIRPSWAA